MGTGRTKLHRTARHRCPVPRDHQWPRLADRGTRVKVRPSGDVLLRIDSRWQVASKLAVGIPEKLRQRLPRRLRSLAEWAVISRLVGSTRWPDRKAAVRSSLMLSSAGNGLIAS